MLFKVLSKYTPSTYTHLYVRVCVSECVYGHKLSKYAVVPMPCSAAAAAAECAAQRENM